MTPAEEIARQLKKARQLSDGSWMACCPAHDDNEPSLAIKNISNGRVLVHCFAGCPMENVWEAFRMVGINAPLEKKPNPNLASPLLPVPDGTLLPNYETLLGFVPDVIYHYRDASGRLIQLIARKDKATGKDIRPITFWKEIDGQCHWKTAALPPPRPIFGLDLLEANKSAKVLVVEGEKTAIKARTLFPDWVVITWSSGAKAVAQTDWSPLRDRDVTIWPDADDAGGKAAQALIEHVSPFASGLKLIKLPTLPTGWDLADDVPSYLDIGKTLTSAVEVDDTLASFVFTAHQLFKMEIPEREFIVDPFFPSSSLAMIFAKRGVGKTWVALCLAIAIARGELFFAYDVPKARRVLFIDGEMPLAELKDRIGRLGAAEEENFLLISSEMLHQVSRSININKSEHQQLLQRTLDRLAAQGRKPDVLILDNISSLGSGIDESDNSALDAQLHWLINLRHQGYGIMLIHHAGKSGDQRGASRREDLLDTSIKLELPDKEKSIDTRGATFTLEFVKTRGEKPQPVKLTLSLREGPDGKLGFQFAERIDVPPHIGTLKAMFDGEPGQKWKAYKTQEALSTTLHVSTATISKHMTLLRKDELVASTGNGIVPTDRGVDRLKKFFGSTLSGGPPTELFPRAKFKRDGDDEVPF